MGLTLPLVLSYVPELWLSDINRIALRCEAGSRPVLSAVGYQDCDADVLLTTCKWMTFTTNFRADNLISMKPGDSLIEKGETIVGGNAKFPEAAAHPSCIALSGTKGLHISVYARGSDTRLAGALLPLQLSP